MNLLKVSEEALGLRARTEWETEPFLPERKVQAVCPVCGKLISEEYLPDVRGFIDERLYYIGDVRITSATVLECDFFHFYDEEEDAVLENPHLLTAVVEAEFDHCGTCTAFEIVEIHPAVQ
jgi:hypothetical protein